MAKKIFHTKEGVESIYLAKLNGKWEFTVHESAYRLGMSHVTLNKVLNFYGTPKRGSGNIFVKTTVKPSSLRW